jgi:hypothetical protein
MELGTLPEKPDTSYTQAVAVLDKVLNGPPDVKSDASFASLRDGAMEVMAIAQRNRLVKSTISKALTDVEQENSERAAKKLRQALLDVRETLSFRVVEEARLPKGFPKWTPVGEIRVQKYPAYRAARTKIADDDESSFMTLFNHIASNRIAMTAPVEMSYQGAEAEDPRASEMAFLYENINVGRTGSSGRVDVVDVPAITAISIGVRGETSPDAVRAAHALLKAWLNDHSDKYVIEGRLRVLGYNSPMIPVGKRYFEVQIPVREK